MIRPSKIFILMLVVVTFRAWGKHVTCPENTADLSTYGSSGNDKYFKLLGNDDGALSWHEAKAQCESAGMGLAEMGTLKNFEMAETAFIDLRDGPSAKMFWVDLRNSDGTACQGVEGCADKFYDSEGLKVDLGYLSPVDHYVYSSGVGSDDCLLYYVEQTGLNLLAISCSFSYRALCSCKAATAGGSFKAQRIMVDPATKKSFISSSSSSSFELPPSGHAALCADFCKASVGCNAFLVDHSEGGKRTCHVGTLDAEGMAEARAVLEGELRFYVVA